MNITINDVLEKNKLKLPSKKRGDWLFYDIESLLTKPFINENKNTEKKIRQQAFFFNGKIISHNFT